MSFIIEQFICYYVRMNRNRTELIKQVFLFFLVVIAIDCLYRQYQLIKHSDKCLAANITRKGVTSKRKDSILRCY